MFRIESNAGEFMANAQAQLRCRDVLISKTEMVCLHCGWVFYWNIKERDLEKMAIKYGELMVVIKGYNPE